MWTTIISAIIAVVGIVTGAVTQGLSIAQQSITQRRAILAQNIEAFIKSKTYNYKDTIYAFFALVCILGLAYIVKIKK